MKSDFYMHGRFSFTRNEIKQGNGKLLRVELDEGLVVGKVKQPNELRARGGITIAVCKNDDGTIGWGYTRCHPEDNYNKKQGRMFALEKAKNGLVTKDLPFDTVRNIARELLNLVYKKIAIFTISEKIKKLIVKHG